MNRQKIVVLDFGSQYAHLIAKRFRALGFYSEIELPSAPLTAFENAKGIVFSGGPASVYDDETPVFNEEILTLDIPMLGLCYGHYVLNAGSGGTVGKAERGEFGFAKLKPMAASPLFDGISGSEQVWMSHQDEVTLPGEGYECIGSTENCRYAALQNLSKKRFSLQFHCEVKDTPCGSRIFENFARFCGMAKNWSEADVLHTILDGIKTAADGKNVMLFLSGGVDSTVTFALLNKALGTERVLGLHIDNGFMRKDESLKIAEAYAAARFDNFIIEDASETFLEAVDGLTDPQKKRAAIGETFIAVRNAVLERRKLDGGAWLLAQGTLYPDVIESGGTKNAKVIKTHHNRVDGILSLIEKGLIIEPLRELYKDEVRTLGRALGLSDALIMRHPFPGPGLSINVLCSDGVLSAEDAAELELAKKEARDIALDMFCEHCAAAMRKTVLPVRSVGVQGDFRTYRFPCSLSFLKDADGFFHVPKIWEKLERAAGKMTSNARFINRTVIQLYQNPAVTDGQLRLQAGYCTRRRLDQTREADAIVLAELHKSGWYEKIFQHLTINLPYASAADRCSLALRPVCSEDVMTARFAKLPHELLAAITHKIAALPYVDAIFFDLTDKPPATFGWE